MRETFKKVMLSSLLASSILLGACSDDPVSVSDPANTFTGDDGVNSSLVNYRKPMAAVTLKIDTKEEAYQYGIDSVMVTLVNGQDGEATVYTDSLGEAVFNNMEMGSYEFIITKSGYAPVMKTISVDADVSEAEVPKVSDITELVELKRLGVTATGIVVYKDKDDNYLPAPLAEVVVTLTAVAGEKFIEGVLYTTTDAAGSYTIANLPEGTSASIKPKALTVNTQRYVGMAITMDAGDFGENIYPETVKMTADAPVLEVFSANTKDFSYTDNMIITLSEAIDAAEIKLGDIKVTRPGIYGSEEILTTYTLSTDLKTVTIVPKANSWDTTGTLTATLNLTSVEGYELIGKTIDFELLSSGVIANIVPTRSILDTDPLDEDLDYVVVTWPKTKNADTYYVYTKTTSEPNYTKYAETTGTIQSISCTDVFGPGKNMDVMVIGVNSTNSSSVETSVPLTLIGVAAPAPSLL